MNKDNVGTINDIADKLAGFAANFVDFIASLLGYLKKYFGFELGE